MDCKTKTMKIITLLLCLVISISSFAQNTKYFRHLRYNHISPFIEITGVHAIDSTTASKTSHYIFKFDTIGRIAEIINNHYHTEKVHPLASLGTYKVIFTYKENKEIRTFYDPNNRRITNDRNVYKEIYLTDNNNVKKQLNFYDLNDKPIESNWKIAEYKWQQTEKYIVEKRYNLQKELVNLSPYFEFGITGIIIDTNGVPQGHYNLNEKLEIIDNYYGTASYQDTYDNSGNHIKYTYHNKNNELVMNQWNYAIGEKIYDNLGNNVQLNLYDTKNKIVDARYIYSNVSITESPIATKKDSVEIKKISLGYLEALQQLKPELMDKVLNDNLNKITIGYDRNEMKQIGRATTKAQMIEFAKTWNKTGTRFPFNPENKIKILDIYNRIATIKLISDNWIEYLQLIKLDGNWEIMNLIWQYRDIKMYKE